MDGAVLSALASSTEPRSGRAIARAAARSQPAVQRVLDRFVDHGIVARQKAGRAFVYTLNREHLAAAPLAALTDLRGELFRRIKRSIEAWKVQPVHASLFGSAARGDGTPASDIDIFIVRPRGIEADESTWRRQLENLAEDVKRWTGNHAGISEIDEDAVARLKDERPPVVDSLENDAIELAGVSVRRLLSR